MEIIEANHHPSQPEKPLGYRGFSDKPIKNGDNTGDPESEVRSGDQAVRPSCGGLSFDKVEWVVAELRKAEREMLQWSG